MLVFLNGQYVEHEQATISVDDRGFVFGDGVYEVFRARNGQVFETRKHFERLASGLQELRIALRELDTLPGIAASLLQRNGLTQGDAIVYLQITRGAAPRAHAFPPPSTAPTVYLSTRAFTPITDLKERGAAAITIPDVRWSRCDIKTIDLIANVVAKQQAVDANVYEAIFVRDSAITDGASSNVFAVTDGVLRTPPKSGYILPGVTRAVTLELASELRIPTVEGPLFAHELGRVDELFLTATTADVLPIVQVDASPIGNGKPGPITRQLQVAFESRLSILSAVASSAKAAAQR